ncbi:hypothetical protein ACUNWD_01945 [Sunxiuqinia sp. A32]|uniref:hypothetical protein n=1 Tax=Sunxiuqinia sp. A32 TaxID=3461496 RepID=UPI0040458A7F
MKKSFILYSFLIIFGNSVFAQKDSTQLKQEVEVVKAYKPSISDAFKINDIPQIQDATAKKPQFNYQITPQPVFTTFPTEPLQAAQMVGEPKAKQGKGLLKLGIGNYQTPYGEFFFNTKAGKKTDFGLHFKHLSSNGKVKLINTDRVDAPESNNLAEMFTKHYFRNSSLNTRLFFDRKGYTYYGYAGNFMTDEEKEMLIPHWQEKQAMSKGGLQLNLFSNEDRRSETNYMVNMNYQYLGSKTGQTEHFAQLGTNMGHDFDSFKGLLDASVTYLKTDSIFNNTSDAYGIKQQILLQIKPSILFEAETASLKAGINLFTMLDDDSDARLLITPNIYADWWPVEGVLALFAGADGYIKHNHYSVIAEENPFVDPYQDVENSEYQYILFGGIKGQLTKRLNYRFQVDYSSIKNQHFYVLNNFVKPENETELSSLNNTFDVQYDDLKQLTLRTELYYTASELVNFHLKGNFYSYDLNTLETAWHKPGFDLTLSGMIHPEGPFSFSTEIFVVGERKAPVVTINPLANSTTSVYTIEPVIDLNFGMEYQYSPKLSFFGRANNFAFQKYESWLGYAQQGFNLLIGLSYSF